MDCTVFLFCLFFSVRRSRPSSLTSSQLHLTVLCAHRRNGWYMRDSSQAPQYTPCGRDFAYHGRMAFGSVTTGLPLPAGILFSIKSDAGITARLPNLSCMSSTARSSLSRRSRRSISKNISVCTGTFSPIRSIALTVSARTGFFQS